MRSPARISPQGPAAGRPARGLAGTRRPAQRGPLLAAFLAAAPALAQTPGSAPLFDEVGARAGLDFVHYNGMSGKLYFPEMVGGGAALLDYDADGDLDLYLVQGVALDDAAGAPPARPGDRLYRNDALPAGSDPPFRLTDVTELAGIAAAGYGMGAAAADLDGDGEVDLYVTRWGSNHLLRNDGDGTFTDVTALAGADDRRWSVSASPVDYDRDGRVDLFIANYVDFTLSTNKPCTSATGARDYCGPQSYAPVPDRLLRNLGGGRFEDASRRSGIDAVAGAALGVVAGDFDGDGWTDVYVANDGSANRLWINRGDGTFVDEALLRGCALNAEGMAEAGMGVDSGDFDNDGDRDLVLGHLSRETNTLYVNDGRGNFRDHTVVSGLGAPSWPFTAFGTAWLDYDNDGWLDLVVVNGAVRHLETLVLADDPYPLHQTNQLFRGLEGRRFEEVTARAGPAFGLSEVSRAASVGDLDNDGDTDLVVGNNNGPARLLLNQAGQARAWLGLRVLARGPNGDALGARARLTGPGGRELVRWVATDGSYAAARDPRLVFGLDRERGGVEVEVVWPDGSRRSVREAPPGRYLVFGAPSRGASGDPAEAR